MIVDEAAAHAAVEARDRRFDGLFFIGVTSTGIYCRCVCTARMPKRENRTFHPSAAAAEKAGFRPCLLCRPELAPGLAPIDAGGRLAAQALARIEAGALEEQGLEELAQDLGVTGRHLRRVMNDEFGASPLEIAQTCRLLTAKRLLRETDLSITQIAFASGFRSLRRFNALVQERYNMTPQRLRGRRTLEKSDALMLQLSARGDYWAEPVFAFLQRRALAGVEIASETRYARTLSIGGASGWIEVTAGANGLKLQLSDTLAPALRPLVSAMRGAFDLDVDVSAIDAHLGDDLGAEGMRIPGGLDPFEIAVRAVLGQQVSLRAARTFTQRLATRFGAPLKEPRPGLELLFPTAARLADAEIADIAAIGLTGRRAETLSALARGVAEGSVKLERGVIAAGRASLARICGIGPWTIEYVALRALGDPDAFPAGDSVLRQALAGVDADQFKPWRAYAVVRAWRGASLKGRDA